MLSVRSMKVCSDLLLWNVQLGELFVNYIKKNLLLPFRICWVWHGCRHRCKCPRLRWGQGCRRWWQSLSWYPANIVRSGAERILWRAENDLFSAKTPQSCWKYLFPRQRESAQVSNVQIVCCRTIVWNWKHWKYHSFVLKGFSGRNSLRYWVDILLPILRACECYSFSGREKITIFDIWPLNLLFISDYLRFSRIWQQLRTDLTTP